MPNRPEIFGRYELLHSVARGGMGEVFLARLGGPAGFEKLLVIKRVLAEFADRPDFVEMFFTEARLAAKLTHRNIVQIFDMGEVDGSYYIAMEHVHGKTLADILVRARSRGSLIPSAHVIDLVGQVCDGLAYAHSVRDRGGPLNLIHRDINPRNIIVSYSGEAKIIDFGIAKSRMQLAPTLAGVIKGKLAYMSPEQSTARRLDNRSDIFSVGICLYELCSFEHPFWRGDRVLTFDSIQRRDPIPLTHYDARLAPFEPLIAKALAKDPENRYPDGGAMRRDLQNLLASGAIPIGSETVSDYMHVLFAEEIAADDDVLRKVTGPSYFGNVVPEVSDRSTARQTWSGPTGKLVTVSRGLLQRVAAVRPGVAAMIAGIGVLAGYGSIEMHALGQRHALAGTTTVVEIPPVPSAESKWVGASDDKVGESPTATVVAAGRAQPMAPNAPELAAGKLVITPTPAPGPEPVSTSGDASPEQIDRFSITSEHEVDGADRKQREARSGRGKKRRERPTKAHTGGAGALIVRTIPAVRVLRNNQRVSGLFELQAPKGRMVIGDGRDPHRDPFRVIVIYNAGAKGIAYRIDSDPWSIVQDSIGAGLGRTPIDIAGGTQPVSIELNNPVESRTLSIVLDYRK